MASKTIHDARRLSARWRIIKRDAINGSEIERVEIANNLSLNEGITEALKLIGGLTATPYNTANARLGVSDGGPSALTGTLSYTNGSTAVTGSGTAFTTELAINDWIYPDAQGAAIAGAPPTVIAGRVASITDNTNLALAANFAGTTATGAASSKLLREIATQTGLQGGTNFLYVGVTAGYPTVSAQSITWKALFSPAQANWAWNDFTLDNGASAGLNLNRKISPLGIKPNTQAWELTLTITLS